MKKFFFLILISFCAYLGISSYISGTSALHANSEAQFNEIRFLIKKGENIKSIAQRLEEEQIINSAFWFSWYLSSNDLDNKVQAGRFTVNSTHSPQEIAEIINGKTGQGEISFTVPEGYTIEQIDKKLTDLGVINKNEFNNCVLSKCTRRNYEEIPQKGSLEGFLFPDTYFIEMKNFESQQLLNKMLDNFHNKWKSLNLSKTKRNPEEIVIMASMIEKEVRTDPDRPLVSGILWKRLDNNWTLGVDATLIYVTKNADITKKDLAIDSKYNTRKFPGLPPTAISNPGLKSLKAAAEPKSSQYWFYLTELKTGRVIYSITNDEHNRNKLKYL